MVNTQERLTTLARLRKVLDQRTTLLIYKQTILPMLDYLSVLVNSSTRRKIVKLQPIQNRAILMRGLPFSTYTILHAIWTHPPPFCMLIRNGSV